MKSPLRKRSEAESKLKQKLVHAGIREYIKTVHPDYLGSRGSITRTKTQVWIGNLNKYARIFCVKGLEKVGAVFSPTNDTPAVVVVCRVSVSSHVVMRLTVSRRLNP